MDQVKAVLNAEQDWIMSQLAAQASHTEGRSVYTGYDRNGIPTIFVLAPTISLDVKEKIRQRVHVPVEFVEINIELL